ncbi:MAG: ABC transporter substrate-binding protein [Pseudomonadota bacterium]
MTRRRLALLSCLICTWCSPLSAIAEEAERTEAAKVAAVADSEGVDLAAQGQRIETFHKVLVSAMQTADRQSRETLLRSPVLELFDVAGIARISIGRTWRQLEQTDQQAFTRLLGELIVATYADRFATYNNQRFVIDEVKPVRSGAVVVSRLVRANDDDVTLDYYLRRGQVFNVVADGVSDLSLRRADYNSIVKQEGFDGLMAHLHRQLATARGVVIDPAGSPADASAENL